MTDPHPIDILVGANLRRLRCKARLSQTALGEKISVSYQQVQKYENGTNRLSASKLWECAEALDVPLTLLFKQPRRLRNDNAA